MRDEPAPPKRRAAPTKAPRMIETSSAAQRKIEFLCLVGVALLLLALPTVSAPFRWLETLAHELGHGLAALATGGTILRIELNFDGSGTIWHQGSSWPALVAFSGYPGAALTGFAICSIADERGAVVRAAPMAIAAIALLAAVLWMRDLASWLVTFAIAAPFLLWRRLVAGARGRAAVWARRALETLGLFLCLSATDAARNLMFHQGPSDAATMAERVLPPASLWAAIWLAIGLAALWFLWRRR